MAELQARQPSPSAASAMDRSSSTFLEQPMLDPHAERQEPSSALQPICFAPEGEGESLHSHKILSPKLPFKHAKWEELQLDNTFSRFPPGATSSTITTNVGDFTTQSTMRISCPVNDSSPVQCSIFIGQPPTPASQQLAATTAASNATLAPCGALAVPREPLHVKGRSLADALAELQRERQKNAELLRRVSSLEARLEEKDKAIAEGGEQIPGASQNSLLDGSKQNKQRKKKEQKVTNEDEDVKKKSLKGVGIKQEDGAQILVPNINNSFNGHGSGVTWMNREVKLPDLEGPGRRDADSERDEFVVSDCTEDDYSSSEEEEDYAENLNDQKTMKETEGRKTKRATEGDISMGGQQNSLDANLRFFDVKSLDKGNHRVTTLSVRVGEDMEFDKKKMKRRKRKRDRKKLDQLNGNLPCYEMVPYKVHSMMASYKKAPKTAFCPKEVKRIMESGVLALKNAQSHTMRKIIVFASLAICHGCEDLYELDFNHFSIKRRGEPHVSPKDPGEHVLYDQPGFRTRVFYPNKQNPVLCPVCILDEERTMRPTGPTCPSCLFLCIKYGGRTRNLPQNEYVRQRMGRNKLKSFGTLMCQMALLVHIRSGSFFFKALGITLLFMAGFPDDMVCKETKYCTLDLLQKYYRSDEDAEGDVLFHPFPSFYPQIVTSSPVPTKVAAPRNKASGKKQPPPLLSKPPGMVASFYLPPITAWPFQGAPFGSPALPSVAGMGTCPLPPVTSPSTGTACAVTSGTPVNVAVTSGAVSPMSPPLYGNLPAYPVHSPSTGGFTSMSFWPTINSFSPSPFPSTSYGYHQQAFAHVTHYGAAPYYGNPFVPFPTTGTKNVSDNQENQVDSSNSDSESSSGGISQRFEKENSSDSNNV